MTAHQETTTAAYGYSLKVKFWEERESSCGNGQDAEGKFAVEVKLQDHTRQSFEWTLPSMEGGGEVAEVQVTTLEV